MNLMEQCQVWNENEEYQKIINAIQALPEETRTPELASELARAYNNIADPDNQVFYKKAIELLKPHEAYFKDDHNWNFRMAYAYYYLDQEGPALYYFEKALEARPGDEDTEAYIEDCRKQLALPRFETSFRERTMESWALFEQNEIQLRRLLDRKDQKTVGGELITKCAELLSPAFADVNFELGFNGEKYELILTPEGDRAKLFELVYFQRRAPKTVLENWNILVGRQPSAGFALRVSGIQQQVAAEDVQVWVEKQQETPENTKVLLTLYCEKLLPLLQEREGTAWWLLANLMDQVLGEIPAMSYIEGLEVATAPKTGPGILLAELPKMLEDMGLKLCLDPEEYLENGYTVYEMEPEEDPEAPWRLDVFTGITRCPVLVNEYLRGESNTMDAFHQDGAVPGFICYPLDSFAGEGERGKAILDFRDTLAAVLLKEAGEDSLTFLGGASGIYNGYLDFIAWDLPLVLNAAAEFFRDSPVEWADFHTFRRDVGTVWLKKGESEEEKSTEKEAEAMQERNNTGSFVGFVLLSEAGWNKEQLIRNLKTDWKLDVNEDVDEDVDEESADTLVFSVGDMMAAVSLMPAPVPDQEAEKNAANNYMWPQAVENAKAHKAHLVVAVLGEASSPLERGKLFAKVAACCCKQKNAIGVYTSGTVFEPRFYAEFAGMMKEGYLPILNWIWFGLYQREGGVCGYTYGMDVFGKDEMEIVDAKAELLEVRDLLINLASYVLEEDVTLEDGETIGLSEEQTLPIRRSQGVSLPGMTLKISYGGNLD